MEELTQRVRVAEIVEVDRVGLGSAELDDDDFYVYDVTLVNDAGLEVRVRTERPADYPIGAEFLFTVDRVR